MNKNNYQQNISMRGITKLTGEQIIEMLKPELIPGERIVQCLDKESFGGKYYRPRWFVTSEGRVYSGYKGRWLEPYCRKTGVKNKEGKRTESRYYLTSVRGNVLVHLLVLNYFGDKTPVKLFGEKNVEGHHIFGFDSTKSCQENSRIDNIQYVDKPRHKKVLNKLRFFKREDMEHMDGELQFLINNYKHNPNAGIKINYTEDGRKEYQIILKCNGNRKEE